MPSLSLLRQGICRLEFTDGVQTREANAAQIQHRRQCISMPIAAAVATVLGNPFAGLKSYANLHHRNGLIVFIVGSKAAAG